MISLNAEQAASLTFLLTEYPGPVKIGPSTDAEDAELANLGRDVYATISDPMDNEPVIYLIEPDGGLQGAIPAWSVPDAKREET